MGGERGLSKKQKKQNPATREPAGPSHTHTWPLIHPKHTHRKRQVSRFTSSWTSLSVSLSLSHLAVTSPTLSLLSPHTHTDYCFLLFFWGGGQNNSDVLPSHFLFVFSHFFSANGLLLLLVIPHPQTPFPPSFSTPPPFSLSLCFYKLHALHPFFPSLSLLFRVLTSFCHFHLFHPPHLTQLPFFTHLFTLPITLPVFSSPSFSPLYLLKLFTCYFNFLTSIPIFSLLPFSKLTWPIHSPLYIFPRFPSPSADLSTLPSSPSSSSSVFSRLVNGYSGCGQDLFVWDRWGIAVFPLLMAKRQGHPEFIMFTLTHTQLGCDYVMFRLWRKQICDPAVWT